MTLTPDERRANADTMRRLATIYRDRRRDPGCGAEEGCDACKAILFSLRCAADQLRGGR